MFTDCISSLWSSNNPELLAQELPSLLYRWGDKIGVKWLPLGHAPFSVWVSSEAQVSQFPGWIQASPPGLYLPSLPTYGPQGTTQGQGLRLNSTAESSPQVKRKSWSFTSSICLYNSACSMQGLDHGGHRKWGLTNTRNWSLSHSPLSCSLQSPGPCKPANPLNHACPCIKIL